VIDISNPSSPVEAGYVDTPGSANGVSVSGNYAYVADYDNGVRVIDISTPSSPVEAGYYDTPGNAYGVSVSGNYAYVADYHAGIELYEFVPPTPTPTVTQTPTITQTITITPTSTPSPTVTTTPDRINTFGREILAFPNPARDKVNFALQDPDVDRVTITIYSLTGDRIARIDQTAPGLAIAWPTSDIAPGIYLVRTTVYKNGVEKQLEIKKVAIVH
jgi:hypothetical protein